jgi:hypothetical protein
MAESSMTAQGGKAPAALLTSLLAPPAAAALLSLLYTDEECALLTEPSSVSFMLQPERCVRHTPGAALPTYL